MFVRGGWIIPDRYSLNTGLGGRYWSSVYNSNNAYYLRIASDDVNPSYSNNQYYGHSVRCVALGG